MEKIGVFANLTFTEKSVTPVLKYKLNQIKYELFPTFILYTSFITVTTIVLFIDKNRQFAYYILLLFNFAEILYFIKFIIDYISSCDNIKNDFYDWIESCKKMNDYVLYYDEHVILYPKKIDLTNKKAELWSDQATKPAFKNETNHRGRSYKIIR